MLGDRSRLVRLLLLAATVCAVVAWPTRHSSAYAAASDDDDDDGGGGGGDDDGAKSGGGDDDANAGDDDDADADQPPVTAGGLYSKTTYPISAIERPLTLIDGMVEVRVALGTDISAVGAFEKWNAGLDAHYGIKDSTEIQFGLHSDLNKFSSFSAYVGFEGALSYDLVDFRAAFIVPVDKTTTTDTTTTPPTVSSSTKVSPGIQVGFPVKYRLKPEVAIIALRNLMTINFRSKPDLTPTVGAIFQPIPIFAAIIQAGVTVKGFNTDAGNFAIPASVAAQLTPSNAIDFGIEFAFPNLKPASSMGPDPKDPTKMIDTTPKFWDSRTLLFFGTFRF